MKKTRTRKLALNRETLRLLEETALGNAAGATGGETAHSGCQGAHCVSGTRCNFSICICD